MVLSAERSELRSASRDRQGTRTSTHEGPCEQTRGEEPLEMSDAESTTQFDEPPSTVNATYVAAVRDGTACPRRETRPFVSLLTHEAVLPAKADRAHVLLRRGLLHHHVLRGGQGRAACSIRPKAKGRISCRRSPQVTSLPVTAIVYSHNHADHMIGTRGDSGGRERRGRARTCVSSPPPRRMRR